MKKTKSNDGAFLKMFPIRKLSAGKLVSGSTKLMACGVLSTLSLWGCKKAETSEDRAIRADRAAVAGPASTLSALGPDFTIAVIPDTQEYMQVGNQAGGKNWRNYFYEQTQWIVDNQAAENIAYVIHLGDISENGDAYLNPWKYIDTAMSKLHVANIPYGVAVGNHDQGNNTSANVNDYYLASNPTNRYNQYFGVAKFATKPWYGGNFVGSIGTNGGNNNDSHYDLFSAGGLDFIVIYIEYDDKIAGGEQWASVNNWAYNLLSSVYPNRKAIIVTHYLTNPDNHGTAPNAFSSQAAGIYNRLKALPNVFMMLGGHVGGTGEGYRQDTHEGSTIKSYTSDYQFRIHPVYNEPCGEGFMRLMKISPTNDLITVKTFSPYKQNRSETPVYETDANSQFQRTLFYEPRSSRVFDFNNNGKTEFGFFNSGSWKIDGMSTVTYGAAGDYPVPADYLGNGKADLTYYRPSDGKWYSQSAPDFTFGNSTDIPVPIDYDGDGKYEFTVFRTTGANAGFWYIYGIAPSGIDYGDPGDIPVPGDYNGDGKTELAVYRPGATGKWYIRGMVSGKNHGSTDYIPVPGDYNGDGKTDISIYNPATGIWHVINADLTDLPNYGPIIPQAAGDIPVPGDYFGAGKVQPAIFRPSNKTLYMYNNGVVTTKVFSGYVAGDKVLNLPYHIRRFFFP